MTTSFKITSSIIAAAFILSACAEEKIVKSTKQPVSAQIIQVSTNVTEPAPEIVEEKKQPEIKRVCIDRITKDGRAVFGQTGQPLQDCRNMRIHKKLEGTIVPTTK